MRIINGYYTIELVRLIPWLIDSSDIPQDAKFLDTRIIRDSKGLMHRPGVEPGLPLSFNWSTSSNDFDFAFD